MLLTCLTKEEPEPCTTERLEILKAKPSLWASTMGAEGFPGVVKVQLGQPSCARPVFNPFCLVSLLPPCQSAIA